MFWNTVTVYQVFITRAYKLNIILLNQKYWISDTGSATQLLLGPWARPITWSAPGAPYNRWHSALISTFIQVGICEYQYRHNVELRHSILRQEVILKQEEMHYTALMYGHLTIGSSGHPIPKSQAFILNLDSCGINIKHCRVIFISLLIMSCFLRFTLTCFLQKKPLSSIIKEVCDG